MPLDRKQLRLQTKEWRINLSALEQQNLAETISANLINLDVFKHSKTIGLYMSTQGEVSTAPILEYAWQHRKLCYLPILQQDARQNKFLAFGKYNKNDILKDNKYAIAEPVTSLSEQISGMKLDLVIVPLVAFDANCNRLGYGGGYYDRTFAAKQQLAPHSAPILVGLAYELQKVSELAHEKWDVPLDYVMTEKKLYFRKDEHKETHRKQIKQGKS